MRIKLNKNIIAIVCIFYYLIISEIFSSSSLIFTYADEIVTVYFLFYIIYRLIKHNKIESKILSQIIIIFLIIFIGIISNLISKVQNNNMAIILDVIYNFKMFISFYGIYLLIDNNTMANHIMNSFSFISKLFLIIGALCGTISIFYDIGMRGQFRFGFYGFNFLYGYAHVYSMMILTFILFVSHSERTNKIYFYILLAVYQMLLTTKGPSIIWAIGILLLVYYMKFNRKINFSVIAFLGLLCVIFGSYQIQNYLFKNNSPRFLFYYYGIKSASDFFPLGAGFASFGSDMAAKFYSPLYIKYGFANRFGMNPLDTSFLRDNFWPMIIGQFGIIGFILTMKLFYSIFKMIQKSLVQRIEKSILISIFLYLLIHSLGSSTPNSSVAMLMMMTVAVSIKSSVL